MVALAWRINSGNMAALSWWGGGVSAFYISFLSFCRLDGNFCSFVAMKSKSIYIIEKKIKNSTMHKIRTIWSTPYDDHMEYSIWWPYGVLHIMTIWSTPWVTQKIQYGVIPFIYIFLKNSINLYIYATWSTPYAIYGVLHEILYECQMEYSIT